MDPEFGTRGRPPRPVAAKILPWMVAFLLATCAAAFVFPLFAQGDGKPYASAARSNVKQLSTAVLLYQSDFDGRQPVAFLGHRRTALGWAGRIKPYAKRDEIFAVLEDRKEAATADGSPISFAFNANAAILPESAALADPDQVVMLFEVAKAHATPDLTDARGARSRLSPVGDATPGGLSDTLDSKQTPLVRYALGLLAAPWDVGIRGKRGAAFGFADGHAKLMRTQNLADLGRTWTFTMREAEKSPLATP